MSRDGPSADSTEGGGEPGSETTISADELYHALAATPRRRVLAVLLDGSTTSVDALADRLAGWESTADGRRGGATGRRRVLAGLHHVHLPLLDDVGLVTRTDDGERVRLASVGAPVRQVIRAAVAYERRVAAEAST